ncbi:alpha/beta hydrolase [Kitasatospora sp. NE20-6]|uniref:alpha/beta fold hydrolase n=1 Tax=Kitasatospora sp. NE20-6 TaxID=2859066 RepID=UPI0034DBA81D
MTSAGAYAHVNGLDLYYEQYGAGRPLIALHGGLLTIGLSFGALIPALAPTRRVVAAELQGHGHTADTDREFRVEHLAEDVLGLLDHLRIARADLFGFSLGGLVALQLALDHPDRVDHLALASVGCHPDGYHDEIRRPELHAGSTRMPTAREFEAMRDAYLATAPHPEHFEEFAAKASAAVDAFGGWPADALRGLAAPTLLIVGDHDLVRLEHAVEMYELVPDARLAVLPRTSHLGVAQRTDLLLPLLNGFLPGPDDRPPRSPETALTGHVRPGTMPG